MVHFQPYKPGKIQMIAKGLTMSCIRNHFSIPVEQFGKMRTNSIPLRQHLISSSGVFPAHVIFEIMLYLRDEKIPFTVDPNIIEFYRRDKAPYQLEGFDNHEYRYYQSDAIYKCLEFGLGISEIGTGGGKTLIGAGIIKNFFKYKGAKKCLYIVPDLALVDQTTKDFNDYGLNKDCNITIWKGKKELQIDSDVVVANSSIILNYCKRNDPSILYNFDLLIVDECHRLRRNNAITDIIKKHIPAQYRFGFTGTLLDEDIPKDRLDRWHIIGALGPIIYKKPSHELREEGYNTKAEIRAIHVEYKDIPEYSPIGDDDLATKNFICEQEYLWNHKFRNAVIVQACKKMDHNALILVDRLEHGETIINALKSSFSDRQIFYIRGEVDVDDRAEIIRIMETHHNVIVVATTKTFSTGINVKNLHYIILASTGKSKVKLLQTIGRGLRKHDTKDKLIIIDIVDCLIYGVKHWENRKVFYARDKFPVTNIRIKEKNFKL